MSNTLREVIVDVNPFCPNTDMEGYLYYLRPAGMGISDPEEELWDFKRIPKFVYDSFLNDIITYATLAIRFKKVHYGFKNLSEDVARTYLPEEEIMRQYENFQRSMSLEGSYKFKAIPEAEKMYIAHLCKVRTLDQVKRVWVDYLYETAMRIADYKLNSSDLEIGNPRDLSMLEMMSAVRSETEYIRGMTASVFRLDDSLTDEDKFKINDKERLYNSNKTIKNAGRLLRDKKMIELYNGKARKYITNHIVDETSFLAICDIDINSPVIWGGSL